MEYVTIICDRCGKVTEGIVDKDPSTNAVIATGGYYVVSEGTWEKFGMWEEELICQKCMWEDPKYKEIYK